LQRLAADLVAEVHRLDRHITAADTDITAAVEHTGTTRTSFYRRWTGPAGTGTAPSSAAG
jgi:hypothetical protein